MPAHKKDTSILTKYRVLYESGKISQMKLSQETNIGKVKIAEFIKENNWNTRLALQNQKKIYKENIYKKILPFKKQYESGEMNVKDIQNKTQTTNRNVIDVIKEYNWNKSNNISKCSSVFRKKLKEKIISAKQKLILEQEFYKIRYEIESLFKK